MSDMNHPETHNREGDEKEAEAEEEKEIKPCCFFFKYGTCVPPYGHCRFDHIPDDGVSPCCFGPSCRNGHIKRIKELHHSKTPEERAAYWSEGGGKHHCNSGNRPAQRDANELAAQLEPFGTGTLKERIATVFGATTLEQLEGASRHDIMKQILECYEKANLLTNRKRIRVVNTNPGAEVPQAALDGLMAELVQWRKRPGEANTRPSINAESYMILRKDAFQQDDDDERVVCGVDGSNTNNNNNKDPNTNKTSDEKAEFYEQQRANLPEFESRKAARAYKKMQPYKGLWLKAQSALAAVDPDFANRFSALAVTYKFQGSPHIDKQNTGPFYGLSIGAFGPKRVGQVGGGGGICVEAAYDTVAVCDTHHRFAKVDGRYPHWVDDYEGERYSLIYYSTDTSVQEYQQPSVAYYGEVVTDN